MHVRALWGARRVAEAEVDGHFFCSAAEFNNAYAKKETQITSH